MPSVLPVSRVHVTRIDSRRPWDLLLTVTFSGTDGVRQVEVVSVQSREQLVACLSHLGVNGIQKGLILAPHVPAYPSGSQIVREALPEEIARQLPPQMEFGGLVLVARGVSAEEMASKLARWRRSFDEAEPYVIQRSK